MNIRFRIEFLPLKELVVRRSRLDEVRRLTDSHFRVTLPEKFEQSNDSDTMNVILGHSNERTSDRVGLVENGARQNRFQEILPRIETLRGKIESMFTR